MYVRILLCVFTHMYLYDLSAGEIQISTSPLIVECQNCIAKTGNL